MEYDVSRTDRPNFSLLPLQHDGHTFSITVGIDADGNYNFGYGYDAGELIETSTGISTFTDLDAYRRNKLAAEPDTDLRPRLFTKKLIDRTAHLSVENHGNAMYDEEPAPLHRHVDYSLERHVYEVVTGVPGITHPVWYLDSSDIPNSQIPPSESFGLLFFEEYHPFVTERPLTPKETLNLVVQLKDTFQGLHSRGVTHRDLKMMNLLTKHAPSHGSYEKSEWLVTDLGASHYIGGNGLPEIDLAGFSNSIIPPESMLDWWVGDREKLMEQYIKLYNTIPTSPQSRHNLFTRVDSYNLGITLYRVLNNVESGRNLYGVDPQFESEYNEVMTKMAIASLPNTDRINGKSGEREKRGGLLGWLTTRAVGDKPKLNIAPAAQAVFSNIERINSPVGHLTHLRSTPSVGGQTIEALRLLTHYQPMDRPESTVVGLDNLIYALKADYKL